MRAFAQVNDEAWYVLVSRARHRVVAFTDCKEALHEQVMLDGDRKSVWEHERDEAKRQQRVRPEEVSRAADLQADAIKTSAQTFDKERAQKATPRAKLHRQQLPQPPQRAQERGRGL